MRRIAVGRIHHERHVMWRQQGHVPYGRPRGLTGAAAVRQAAEGSRPARRRRRNGCPWAPRSCPPSWGPAASPRTCPRRRSRVQASPLPLPECLLLPLCDTVGPRRCKPFQGIPSCSANLVEHRSGWQPDACDRFLRIAEGSGLPLSGWPVLTARVPRRCF